MNNSISLAGTKEPQTAAAAERRENQDAGHSPGSDGTVGEDFPLRHGHVPLENGTLHFAECGAGDLVVLLPGWPETWYAWRQVMTKLSGSYRVIAFDPPGIGDSSADLTGYDTKSISTLLRTAIRSFSSQPIFLVGHDVGAWIAYAYAAQWPQEVRGLVLLEAGIPGVSPSSPYPLPPEANLKAWQFSFNALPDLPEALTGGREQILFDWLFDRKAAHPEAITAADRAEYLRAYTQPGRMQAGFAYYRAVPVSAAQNREWRQKKLTMPVLALGGERGVGHALREALAEVAERVEGGTISDCGHYIPEEQPEQLSRRLLIFFSAAVPATPTSSRQAEQQATLPGARNIDHVGVSVPDLEQAVTFFQSVLGAKLLWQVGPFEENLDEASGRPPGKVRIATLRCGPNLNLELLEYQQAGQNRTMPQNTDWGASHLAIWVEDIEAASAYLDLRGLRLLKGPLPTQGEPKKGEVIRYFVSPWGMYLELVWRPPHLPYEDETSARLYGPAPAWNHHAG